MRVNVCAMSEAFFSSCFFPDTSKRRPPRRPSVRKRERTADRTCVLRCVRERTSEIFCVWSRRSVKVCYVRSFSLSPAGSSFLHPTCTSEPLQRPSKSSLECLVVSVLMLPTRAPNLGRREVHNLLASRDYSSVCSPCRVHLRNKQRGRSTPTQRETKERLLGWPKESRLSFFPSYIPETRGAKVFFIATTSHHAGVRRRGGRP